jgi:glycosyltransferase involved in cell wall biosynthesis
LTARQELENARAFDRILVNSYFSRESVSRAYGIDAHVCYLGVDSDLFVAQRKPRDDVVIGLGSITPVKNVALVVQALGCIPPPRPQLLWIGNVAEPEYADAVTKLAAALEVPFELRVRVSDDELVDLLNRARVMAYAPRLEPFGFAPLEANACGLPVVAVAEGGLRETIVDGVNGVLVESDPQQMATGIERLRRDPEYAAGLGADGRRLVEEQWSLAASIDRLESHLQDTLTEKLPSRTARGASPATPDPTSTGSGIA